MRGVFVRLSYAFEIGKLVASAQDISQRLPNVACSTGVVDRSLFSRIATQYLSCALVRGRGIVLPSGRRKKRWETLS